MSKMDEAMQAYERALRIRPDSVAALNNMGLLLQDSRRPEEAIARYDEALAIQPDFVDAKWNKSLSLLTLGRYREGWELFETGLGSKRGKLLFHSRRWDGRELSGQRLLIWSGKGLGDCLQFVRYAALCKEKGATVIVQAPEPLVRLLKNCPSIDEVVSTATEDDFDYQISMMSLPHIFGTELDTVPSAFPYLFTDEAARQKWAPKFAGVTGFKAGLVWAGSPRTQQIEAHLIDRRRSLNLSQLQPLLDVKGIRFYSLQAGPPSAQIDKLGLRNRIVDHIPEVEDFLDTAALIENLDLVITVDTSVAHLAGALGKPVWILSRFDACWRWPQNREQNPWYPSASIFAQTAAGDWGPVIGKIRDALAGLIRQEK